MSEQKQAAQPQQIQVQVKEVSLTIEEVEKLDAALASLPYRDVKPAYDILNAAVTRTVNALAKEAQEKQAAALKAVPAEG